MSQAGINRQDADYEINQAALEYHASPRPGKISVEVTKLLIKGEALLFKHFADIDVLDIEVKAKHPMVMLRELAGVVGANTGLLQVS